MKPRPKHFHRSFAGASLGIALLVAMLVPCPVKASPSNNPAKKEAANNQFIKAEELRDALNNKASEKRTLAEYKRVVANYQRVYVITPHAIEVPDALLAVAELNTEMGDRFGRSYYQTAVDSYQFLIREYPRCKFVQDAMLRIGQLQKDQLGDPAAATMSFQDFQKKFPRSGHKREVQEALAELALLRNAENGKMEVPSSEPVTAAESSPEGSGRAEVPTTLIHASKSGGERAKSGSVPRVENIRTTVTPDSTEIIIDLEDSVQYISGRIANPDRIYFDLHAARLTPSLAKNNIQVSGNLLTQIRVAQNQSGIVRVVLDVNGVKDYAASLLRKPSKLVIELYGDTAPVQAAKVNRGTSAPTKENERETVAGTAASPDANAKPVAKSVLVAAEIVPPAPMKTETATSKTATPKAGKATVATKPDLVRPSSSPQPTRDGQSTLTRALGLKIGRIVIDAGHGGHDTGTIGPTGLMEKDLCLDVALRLGKIIQQKLPGADIVMTRTDDTFVPLEERTRIANEAKADLFISIHANSSPDHGARGVETYYLNLKGSPEAMEVAARENAVSQENFHELEDVVKKIARTEKIDESKELAEDVQDSLTRRMQKTAKQVRSRGVRKAPFVVLIGADMPSILTEISFLSNPADEQLLKKPEHRQRVAEGLYQGVVAYLQNLNSVTVNTSGKPVRPPVVPTVEQSRNQK
jgi:N-acetylmuramoyl-L-alanine amidase